MEEGFAKMPLLGATLKVIPNRSNRTTSQPIQIPKSTSDMDHRFSWPRTLPALSLSLSKEHRDMMKSIVANVHIDTVAVDDKQEALRAVFNAISGSSSGSGIGLEEWVEVCNSLNLNLSENELRRLFHEIDLDASGKVEFEDFVAAMTDVGVLQSILQIHSADGQLRTVYQMDENFDFSRPTSENYCAPMEVGFHGMFADIRATRDYQYHVNFVVKRQQWQDALIDAVVSRTIPQPSPWILYTCGPMGAGKGHVLSWMSEHGFLPLEHVVHVDPDYFKTAMPEWRQYVERGCEAGVLCHKESGYIAEIAQEVALRRKQNIWVDGSLRDHEWYSGVFDDIRERFPEYSIAIFYVHASEKAVRERINKRAKITGRTIPERLIVDSLKSTSQSVSILTTKVDFVANILNEGAQPQLLAFESIDRSASFSTIQTHLSTSLKHDRFPDTLQCDMFWVSPISPSDIVVPLPFQNDPIPLTAKPAHDHVIHCTLKPNALKATPAGAKLTTKRHLFFGGKEGDMIDIWISPVAEVDSTILGFGPVPTAAKYVAWMYPLLAGLQNLIFMQQGIELDDPVVLILRQGGFLYLSPQGQPLALNWRATLDLTLLTAFAASVSQYQPPLLLSSTTETHLRCHGRWFGSRIRDSIHGAGSEFAWIRPKEKVLVVTGNQTRNVNAPAEAEVSFEHGAMAFRFPGVFSMEGSRVFGMSPHMGGDLKCKPEVR
eukprot:c23136_g1_i1.p1 GENE.c23136_g1_i1~~c23136_g1_i1.p1  ORF type:complete len:726 (-),score=154.13 c23136_g1_i1:13-2160(-)